MIVNGNATLYVSDMDRSIAFYTEVLELKLSSRYGNDWATVQAGVFTIGLHPRHPDHGEPGSTGGMEIGLSIEHEIEKARLHLIAAGVQGVQEIHSGSGGSFCYFRDPDGNRLYYWQEPDAVLP